MLPAGELMMPAVDLEHSVERALNRSNSVGFLDEN